MALEDLVFLVALERQAQPVELDLREFRDLREEQERQDPLEQPELRVLLEVQAQRV